MMARAVLTGVCINPRDYCGRQAGNDNDDDDDDDDDDEDL